MRLWHVPNDEIFRFQGFYWVKTALGIKFKGTFDMLNAICNILTKEKIIKKRGKKVFKDKDSNCHSLVFAGNHQVERFYNYIYKNNPEMFFTRKRSKMYKVFEFNKIPRKGKTSKYKGISYDRGKTVWIAQYHCMSRSRNPKYIGRFKTELEAYEALVKFEQENNLPASNPIT